MSKKKNQKILAKEKYLKSSDVTCNYHIWIKLHNIVVGEIVIGEKNTFTETM